MSINKSIFSARKCHASRSRHSKYGVKACYEVFFHFGSLCVPFKFTSKIVMEQD